MKRHGHLTRPFFTSLLITFLCLEVTADDYSESVDRPNVILMMADDLGWGDTSFNGHPRLKTPGLDAMAKNGLRFNRFYAAAPVCSPTRGSCLTGRHPTRYGVFSANVGHLPQQEITLAEYLKDKGYRTGHFGKWHLGTLTTEIKDSNRGGARNTKHFSPPWKNGFDQTFSTEAKTPTYDPLLKPAGKVSNKFWLPLKDRSKGVPYGTYYWRNGEQVKEALPGDDSEIIMNQALQFIEQQKEGRFFAVIWFHSPHLPVVASDKDRMPFTDMDQYSQSYLGSVQALDRQVSRLRNKLKQLEIAENTMVCFCSDNGPEGNNSAPGSAGKLRGRKRSLYEGGIRVPGIIEYPKQIKKGLMTDFPASTSDYFPTIAELVGGELPRRPMDGESLVSLFANPAKKRESAIFFESRKTAVVSRQRFKLVATINKQKNLVNKTELYDLVDDPGEKRDLASEFPQKVKSLTQDLQAWRKSCSSSLSGRDY